MANTVANAIDWYINKLNTLHLIPANAAAMARDITAKQFSDGNFTPRPLTEDNFTDAELDAIYRLSHSDGKTGNIDAYSYSDVSKGGKDFSYYGDEDASGLDSYLSPIRVIGTSLGQAAVKKVKDKNGNEDHKVVDTFDYNPFYSVDAYKTGDDDYVLVEGVGYQNKKDVENMHGEVDAHAKSTYSRFRNNAARLGHKESDPDHQKIKTDISINNIKNRLGDSLNKHDIFKRMSKREFITKGVLAGGLTGAAVGSLAGVAAGSLMLLVNKKLRKRWIRNLLLHAAGGAAIGALALGTAGGVASNGIYDKFKYTKEASDKKEDPKKKEKKRRDEGFSVWKALATIAAYGAPLAAVAAATGYAGKKAKGLYNELLATPYKKNVAEINFHEGSY